MARQQFPLGVIGGSLALVLGAGTRLQRAADVLAMHWKWCGLDVRSASYYSVRLWLLRLGLHQLIRPKAQADDWMWIMDHTMQLGERKRLRKQVLEFVQAQGEQARDDERLLGSSEVLESIIGKFKHVAGEGGRHGLTGMVLSIGALVGEVAVATVHTAMTEVTTRGVWDWCRAHLGTTVQSVRQQIRHALHPEQKQKTLSFKTG